MRRSYKKVRFQSSSLALITKMNEILEEYRSLGYMMTIRQLYYQLVARGVIENSMQSYRRIVNLCNEARLGGVMDWNAIEDRTREFMGNNHWTSGREIIEASAQGFKVDMWDNQPVRMFAIVEKEAMTGVMSRICGKLDIPLLAARGYPSVTVLHDFVTEVALPTVSQGQEIIILHLGDHDPSGIDMTRDLEQRITMFMEGYSINLRRIALNMDQIEEQKPPPNPAKMTDSRFQAYSESYGDESWELDALSPTYIDSLVRKHVEREIDTFKWEEKESFVRVTKEKLSFIAKMCYGEK